MCPGMGRCKRTFCTIISRLPQIYHMQTYIWSILIHDDSCAWQIQQCPSWNAGEKKKNATTNPMQTHTHIRVFPSSYTWPHLQRFHTIEKPQTREVPAADSLPPNTGSRALSSAQAGRSHVPEYTRPPTPVPPRGHTCVQSSRARRLRWGWGQGPAGGRVVGPGLGAQGGDEGRARGGARLTWAGGSS